VKAKITVATAGTTKKKIMAGDAGVAAGMRKKSLKATAGAGVADTARKRFAGAAAR
jgi:hypothetical protein